MDRFTTMKKLALLIAIIATAIHAEPITQNLWPATPPGPASKTDGEERDLTKPEDKLIAGRRIIKLGHVSTPQMQALASEGQGAIRN